MRYMLSVDGGGIRGVIPAIVLQSLEEQTGKLSRDIFSFVAGTSTGALIAGAVAAGIPAKVIVDIYLKRTKEIFTPGAPWNTIKRVVTGSMYNPKALQAVLTSTFGPAKDWSLNHSPIDILLTAKRVSDGKPWYFVKDKAANAGTTGSFGLVDCAVASAAAPTYFSPWPMKTLGDMIDGGIGVTGNPVYQLCVEAFDYSADYSPDETFVLSLGTGSFYDSRKPSGLLGWLEWTLDELLNSPEEQQTQIVRRSWPKMPLYRFDVALPRKIAMDDASAVPELIALATKSAGSIDWRSTLQLTK